MFPGSVDFMQCALSLAKLALGYTSPNPAVGAVVTKEETIVGLGYTQPPGYCHAEIMALQQAGDAAKGGTLYVTLEPCCHHGRTPPCTQAIIAAGISEVHVATLDPNPLVFGRGMSELQKAGIKTYVGEHEDEALEINEAYIKYITTGMPFVTVKFAMSLDGKIATRSGDSKWIGDEEMRKHVHNLRRIVDALVVGVNTVIVDNPRLTARGSGGKGGRMKTQPLRIIVDSKGRTPPSAQIFKQPGKTLLAVAKPFGAKKSQDFTEAGVEVVELPQRDGMVDLEELLKILGKREITSVLVEGGGTLLGSLFDNKLVDKVLAFISPIIIGGKEAKTPVEGRGVERMIDVSTLNPVRVENVGNGVLVCGYIKAPGKNL